MKNVAIYCGSSQGFNKLYQEEVIKLAEQLVKQDIHVIYGAGNVGLMGILANKILEDGGEITGIIPDFLVKKEVSHAKLTTLEIVKDMHQRKARMIELSDGFIAMPGGFGTLDEIFEVLTWEQLTLHDNPIGFYNINGYFNSLIEFLKTTVEEGFIKKRYLDNIIVSANPDELIDKMTNQEKISETEGKWVK